MKLALFVSVAVLAGALTTLAQNQKTNAPPIQGSAIGQVPNVAPKRPLPPVVRERQYHYGGVVNDIAKGQLLKPAPEAYPRSPAQNPAVDMMTGRPRGVVLWSWNF
jgi:hypothetical protein